MKKLFTVFLALLSSVGTIFAESGTCGENLTWDLTNGVLTISGSGAMNDFSYPDYAPWFSSRENIFQVVINYGVTSIGNDAFRYFTALTYITIPNSVTSIGDDAFYECTSLASVTIPNSVISIGNAAFFNCDSLTIVEISSSVISIGNYAFRDCDALTSVTMKSMIPPSLLGDMWGDYHFANCNRLNAIYVPCGSLDTYKTDEKWSQYAYIIKYKPYPSYSITLNAEKGYITTTSTEAQTICDTPPIVTCTAQPAQGFYFVRWADGNTDNPRTIELTQDTTMEAIFDYLLTGKCGKDNALTWTLDTTTMELNITGQGALSENYTYCKYIESLTIGNDVTSIGQNAFSGCNNLKNVIIGSSVKVLEYGAFSGCSSVETITCYSQRPPTVNGALYGVDYSTIVYVPAEYLETYKMHDAWGLYDVRPLGAIPVETNDVQVEPAETTATVAWPAVSGAASYELVIKDKSGNVICTLIFNANGQLTQIAFNAPAREQSAGFSFTVTGLEEGKSYDLTITAKNDSGATLDEKTVSFTTTGSPTEGLNQITNDLLPTTHKVFRNSQILILRGDRTYTIDGRIVH